MCSAKKKEDRRRARRIECKNVLVNYRQMGLLRRVINRAPSLDEKSKRHPVLDISRTGMSFLTSDKLDEGQELVMRISFGPRRPNVDVNGEVTWRDEGKGQHDYSVGVRFIDITPSAWHTLLHLNKFVVPSDTSEAWKLRGEGVTRKSKSWSEKSKPRKRDRKIKDGFLRLTSEIKANNLESLLNEQKGRPCAEFQGVDSSKAKIARELKSLRQNINDVDVEANPLRAYLQLEGFSDRFSCLKEVELPEELDKQREIVLRKLENKREKVEDKWNPRAHRIARKIAKLGRRVDRMLDRMIQKLQETSADREDSEWTGITEQTRQLSDVIRRIQVLVDRVPDAQCESLPFWDLLIEARENLLKPHARNVFLFKCAAAVARANGDLKAHERDLLGSIADEIHLSPQEEKRLIRRAQDIGTSEFDGSPDEARQIIHHLYLCATTEDEMSEAEENVLKRIASNWGVKAEEVDEILDQRKRVNQLARQGIERVKDLIKQVKEGSIKNCPEEAKAFHRDVAKLANLINQIEKQVSRIPEMHVKDLPDWEMLRSARENIIRPHRQNIFLLKASLLMVVADGEATEPEKDFLNAIVDQMRFPRSLAMKSLENPEKVSLPEFEGTRKEARAMVQKLYRCALADGSVDQAEKEFLGEVAHKLGVSRPEVIDEVTRLGEQESTSFLDRVAVMKRVRELDELGEGIKVGADIDDGMREYIESHFEVPEGDTLLMTYENHLMEDMLECGALTPHCLLLRTPDHEKKSIEIADIKGVDADGVATYLLLEEERCVQMSRMAEPFIHLVVDSVRKNQRHL